MSLPDVTEMDKDNVLLLGLTACALGLSLFILLGPKLSRKNHSSSVLIGLQNLGLTCFLNSLLQALASCPSFIDWLRTQTDSGPVSKSLYSVLKDLCYERRIDDEETISPNELIYLLRGKVWPVYPQEQDPHELLLHLLSLLEDEQQKRPSERIESLLDALGPEDIKSSTNLITGSGDVPMLRRITTNVDDRTPKSKIPKPSPFRGYLASDLSCCRCKNKSAVVYDKFDSISLALPSKGSTFKLYKLLDDFVSFEEVDGFKCEHCNKDKDNNEPPIISKAFKALKIGKLPKCLCFHISRTYMSPNGHVYKKENYVEFPEYLNMSRYTHMNSMLKEKHENSNGIKFDKAYLDTCLNTDTSLPLLTKFKSLAPNLPAEESSSHEQTTEQTGNEIKSISKKKHEIDPGIPTLTKFSSLEDDQDKEAEKENRRKKIKKNHSIDTTKREPMYRLKAVIEHKGTVETGHFVTYRKGPLESDLRHRSSELVNQFAERWYFTSDEVVKNSSLSDAQMANAFLLFYEKCSPRSTNL